MSKKKQFYRLKIHNQHQIANQERKKLTKKFEHTQHLTYTRLRTLYEHLKAVSQLYYVQPLSLHIVY